MVMIEGIFRSVVLHLLKSTSNVHGSNMCDLRQRNQKLLPSTFSLSPPLSFVLYPSISWTTPQSGPGSLRIKNSCFRYGELSYCDFNIHVRHLTTCRVMSFVSM